jgi:hypothetical protein
MCETGGELQYFFIEGNVGRLLSYMKVSGDNG